MPPPPPPPTPPNAILLQAFEWHTPSSPPGPDATHSPDSHWTRLTRLLPSLAADLGVTHLWLPPGCKANNPTGNGYDCYDLWDLGEFDQKWARSTKWGSREELRDLVAAAGRCHDGQGVAIVWDAVLSHKTAGDATEEAWAVEVDALDRRVEICAPKKIEAWLQFDFPGRRQHSELQLSALQWRAEHFNGTDWDQRAQRTAIYKLIDDPATFPRPSAAAAIEMASPTKASTSSGWARLTSRFNNRPSLSIPASAPPQRPGKTWAPDVDLTHGNYDYLMFSNIDYSHATVRADVLRWGAWMVHSTGVRGFRLDAAQHISASFTRAWIAAVHAAFRQQYPRAPDPPLVVGEVLAADVTRITRWLDAVTPSPATSTAIPDPAPAMAIKAFDAPLLYSFSRVSEDVRQRSPNADLRTLLAGHGPPSARALSSLRPGQSIPFITNHDTQPGQTSFTPILPSLKPLFYAFTLLRAETQSLPCVFWGDCVGTHGPLAAPATPHLATLMRVRRRCAYGFQRVYEPGMRCVGWTRAGTHDRPEGCAVVLSIAAPGTWSVVTMRTGGRVGEVWVDVLRRRGAGGAEGHDDEKSAGHRSSATETGPSSAVTLDGGGRAAFACRGMSVAVYVRREVAAAVAGAGAGGGDGFVSYCAGEGC